MTARTGSELERTGCIEDRTFFGVEKGELWQVPGADLFFTIARDISVFVNTNVDGMSISNSVAQDARKFKDSYTLHNDDGHGEELDGCGFAAKLKKIMSDVVHNYDEVKNGAHISEQNTSRAIELVSGLRKLIEADYIDATGGNLIEIGQSNGASIITYTGDHTAELITVDESDETTYDSADANDPLTPSIKSFNLDTNHARKRAGDFDLSSTDSEILARLLATSTVRILSDYTITELTEVSDENGA